MSDLIIRVENLGKLYHIGGSVRRHRTLRDEFVGLFPSPSRKRSKRMAQDATMWALRGVTFQVAQGEILGVIGPNGAGKSTLLKILARITEPTEGGADIVGRVGTLLEVGTGFHPELTGRENIYLSAAILGMKRAEIRTKFDEIVSFAEVEQFVDTPIKHFSTGMGMRLAFAVAAHLEPEILLIDEVLAVGDAAFQKKCLGKMGDVAKDGRTILFVSHNLAAMESLCGRMLWLDHGAIVAEGTPPQIVSAYLEHLTTHCTEQLWGQLDLAPGNDKVRLHSARVRPLAGTAIDPINIRTPFILEFEYWNLQPGTYLAVSVAVRNEHDIMVFNTETVHEPMWQGRAFPTGLFRSAVVVPGDLLNEGSYRVELVLLKDQRLFLYDHPDLLSFDVQDSIEMRRDWYGKWPGVVHPNLEWCTELLERA